MPDPIISPLSVFYLLGIAQAVFLALALLTANRGNHKANRYLAFVLFIFSLTLFVEFLDVSLYGLHAIWFMVLAFPTDMLLGPLLWLYVRNMTGKTTTIMGIKPLWHFVPFAIYAAVIWVKIPETLSSDFLTNHPDFLLGNNIELWIVNDAFALITSVPQIAIYLIACLITLKRYAREISNTFSYTEGVELKWLRRLVSLLIVIFIAFVFRIVFGKYLELTSLLDTILNASIVLVIYALGFFGVRQPFVFSKLEKYEKSSSNTNSNGQKIDSASSTVAPEDTLQTDDLNRDIQKPARGKYQRSSLTTSASEALTEQLTSYMENEKPYLENELNLAQLSSLIDITPNHLSQVINEKLNLNFFDFVNSYRVGAAKQQLMEGGSKKHTILRLALDSGFNSKSAFYAAFKKHTGMTPTQFRKHQSHNP